MRIRKLYVMYCICYLNIRIIFVYRYVENYFKSKLLIHYSHYKF